MGGPQLLVKELKGELNHVRTRRERVHEPVRTLVNTLIFRTGECCDPREPLPCEKCRQLPPHLHQKLMLAP